MSRNTTSTDPVSKYVRKTRDEYDIQQLTAQGWETVTTEETRRAAREQWRAYMDNQPEYPVRVRKHRVPIEGGSR